MFNGPHNWWLIIWQWMHKLRPQFIIIKASKSRKDSILPNTNLSLFSCEKLSWGKKRDGVFNHPLLISCYLTVFFLMSFLELHMKPAEHFFHLGNTVKVVSYLPLTCDLGLFFLLCSLFLCLVARENQTSFLNYPVFQNSYFYQQLTI
jgi:hypothetical protein